MKKALSLNADFTAIRLDYGDLLCDMGKPDLAIAEYEKYAKAFPKDINVFLSIANAYEVKGDTTSALTNYSKAHTLDAKNVTALKGLARCYHMQKNYIYALKYYDEALKLEPDNSDLLINKAIALHANDELESAIKLYKEVLTKDPKNKRVKENLLGAINTKGGRAIEYGKYSDAILAYNESLQVDINNDYAYYGLGVAYQKMGNKTKAVENYEKAISINSENKNYLQAYESLQEPEIKPSEKQQNTANE